VPGFQPLLGDLDLTGAVVTADALQTHAQAAEFLVTVKQADDLFTVKANQPTLLDRCAGLPWHQVPVLDRTRDQAHGRVEIRTLKAVTSVGSASRTPLRSPGHPQDPQSAHTTTVYAVTSLTFQQASPARLADLLGGTGESRTGCTTCGTSPSPRTPPGSAPGPPRRSWRPWATWPSACCAAPGRSTSPPRSAITAAIPTGPWPPSASAWDATNHRQDHRSPAVSGDVHPCWPSGCSVRAAGQGALEGGLVPMTTVAESSSELATRAISPSRMKASAARGA
jgi:hypothetical protein